MVILDMLKGKEQILLIGAVYVLGFYTSLICTQKLNKKEVYWNNKKNTLFYSDNKMYAYYSYYSGQTTLKYNKPKSTLQEASFAAQLKKPLKHLLKPLQNEAEGCIQYQQLGHTGKDAIEQLLQSVTGALLKGLTTVKCKSCRISKAYKIVSRRPPTQLTVPFHRVHLNLILGIVIYNDNRHAAYFLNNTI